MRTTVNIDERLLAEAKNAAARTNRTLGEVIDDALRVLFIERQQAERTVAKITLPVDGGSGLRPGVNLEDKEQMAELLGDNEFPRADR
jgi:hypothetical protein